MAAWQPGTSQSTRCARDQLYRQIRQFFHQRQYIEVDPPLLGRAGSTDIHLHSLPAQLAEQTFYLQTSPEFFMKRLLAAGSGPIFALTKSFRGGEQGRYHNVEFTILEWYQPGFNDHQLMAQAGDLLQQLFATTTRKIAYRDCFIAATGLNPHTADIKELHQCAQQFINIHSNSTDRDNCLDLIFSHCVQPALQTATLVFDYPASQAALAKTGCNEQGEAIAHRFEVFYRGVELGNGYWELTDSNEQAHRFVRDNQRRQGLGLPQVEADHQLVAALAAGLPQCAGIAMGVDRLLMLQTGHDHINEVMDFPKHLL